jgi:MFS family permease
MNRILREPPVTLPAAKPPRPPRANAVFPGWYVVAGAFLLTMVGYGAIYSYAAFADEIAASFGSSRSAVTLVYALSGGACFFISALTGPLADRIGARVLGVLGMLLVALGFLVAASASSLLELCLGYGLVIGLGVGCAYVPAVAAVQRWFSVHRGLASGLAVSGIGIGTALVPPMADWLESQGDWRFAFLVLAGLSAAVGLAGAALLRPAPRAPHASPLLAPGRPAPPPDVLRREFGLVYLGTLLVSVPATLPHALLVSTARDLGLDRQEAVALLGLIGIGTIVGRFLLAAVADAVGRRLVFLLSCAGMAASMAGWAVATEEVGLQAFALGFGALQGGFVALLPAFVADAFGARLIGGLIGVLYTARGIALLATPPAAAAAFAWLDAHGLPLAGVAVAGLLGTLLLARGAAARSR